MADLTGFKDEFSKNEAEDDLEDFEEYYKKEEE
jgi:hypothetical protein